MSARALVEMYHNVNMDKSLLTPQTVHEYRSSCPFKKKGSVQQFDAAYMQNAFC